MKTYFLTLFFACCFSIFSYCQLPLDYSLRTTLDLYNTNKTISRSTNNVSTGADINGSPYLNDEFIIGTLYTVHKIQYADIPLRYNIYNDNLEFKTPSEEIQALAAPEIIEKAVIGETLLTNSPYLFSGKIKKGFFIIIEQGKASLYAKPGVVFLPATQPAAYKDAEPSKFAKKPEEYFIRIETGPAQLVTSKKNLISIFPDNQDKTEIFISKNKIKTNKHESLKELVKYYNSL